MEKRKAPQEPERECCLVLALRRNQTLIPRIEGMPSTKWEMIHIFVGMVNFFPPLWLLFFRDSEIVFYRLYP